MSKEMSYEAAKEMLKIDVNNLSEEIAMHPVILGDIAEKTVYLKSQKDSFSLKVETTEAQIAQEIRSIAVDKKLTEATVKEMVLIDPRRIALNEESITIYEEYNLWNALYGAFQSRGYMLRDLAQLSTNMLTAPDNWTPPNYMENRASVSRTRRPITELKEG